MVEVPHVILLLLIPGEDADFTDVAGETAVQDRRAEGAGAAGDEEGGVLINHFKTSFLDSSLMYSLKAKKSLI